MTGLEITRLVLQTVCRRRHDLPGGGAVGAALLEQKVDGVFFPPAPYATGALLDKWETVSSSSSWSWGEKTPPTFARMQTS